MNQARKPTIAIFLASTQNEYSDQIIEGFYACAREEDVNLVFLLRAATPYHNRDISFGNTEFLYNIQFGSIYDYVPAIKPDALIIAYGSLSTRKDVPIKRILVERYGDVPILFLEDTSGDLDVPYLLPDNYGGMYQCVEHLVRDHGYKRVAFMAGPKKNFESNERLRAYRDVCAAYGLDVLPSYVVHGDYSEYVEEKVEQLLDKNPGLEAIVFANDNMAKAGYRVCAKRNLMVGRDLAITGFDDVNIARSMTPPLTSVMHSSFVYSYQALQNALALSRGEKCTYQDMPTTLRKRESCGCDVCRISKRSNHKDSSKIRAYMDSFINRIMEELFLTLPYEEEKKEYGDHVHAYFDVIFEDVFVRGAEELHKELLIFHLNEICKVQHISSQFALEKILELTRELMSDTWEEKMRAVLAESIELAQRVVHSNVIFELQGETELVHRQSWFLSSFLSELLMLNTSASENMKYMLRQIKTMNIPSAYFFLYRQPVRNHGWSLPEKMEHSLVLAGYYNEDGMFAAEDLEQQEDLGNGGVCACLKQDGKRFYFTFPLFSGEEQYGILVCEIERKDIYFMLSCSMQLGALFQVLRIDEAEKAAQKELKESMELIKEKNAILSSLSENDELTRLLNRRGFVEKAIHAIKNSVGRRACLLFADLDHLKEINDCFGHGAGDMALCKASDYLREAFPEEAIISRFGGDEFVALALEDDEFDSGGYYEQEIKRIAADYNAGSDIGFFIEMSVGLCRFVCSEDTDLRELLKQSDELLYQKKKNRRTSIKK